MFNKAIDLKFKTGTLLEVVFQTGEIKQYDMSVLFKKYPQLEALKDRALFTSGKLSPYGIIWSDDLDIEVETIYEEGVTVGFNQPKTNMIVADAVKHARAIAGISQKELSEKTGIDQADISRIERGLANPSVSTLERIAEALNAKLSISIA